MISCGEPKRREAAPALKVWGPLAPRIVALIAARPLLSRRVLCAPSRAMHAMGAFLHHGIEADQPDVHVADVLNETDPRALLQSAFPAVPPRLFRVLDRAGPRVRDALYYCRLAALASGDLGDLLMAGDGVIGDGLLDHLERVARMEPWVRALPKALLVDSGTVDALAVLIQLLKHYEIDGGKLLAGMPPHAGLSAVYRRISRAIDSLQAPDPGFEVDKPLQWLNSVADLKAVGRRLKLCVREAQNEGAEHWMRLVAGSSVYLLFAEAVALVELRKVESNLWVVGQISSTANRPVSPVITQQIRKSLQISGVKLLAMSPAEAVERITSRHGDQWSGAGFARWDLVNGLG